MDDILLPMTRGNMEDIENEGREAGESALEYSSGMNTQVSQAQVVSQVESSAGTFDWLWWELLGFSWI